MSGRYLGWHSLGAIGLLFIAGSSALAADEYYIVQDASTKQCAIVDSPPTTTKLVLLDNGKLYVDRNEAERADGIARLQRSARGKRVRRYTSKRRSNRRASRQCQDPIKGFYAYQPRAKARTITRSCFEFARATVSLLKEAHAQCVRSTVSPCPAILRDRRGANLDGISAATRVLAVPLVVADARGIGYFQFRATVAALLSVLAPQAARRSSSPTKVFSNAFSRVAPRSGERPTSRV